MKLPVKPDLSVHFLDCGQGNMQLIVTPSMTLIYDCRITEENQNEIFAHLKTYVPIRTRDGEKQQWIDCFICSHRDQDHIHGIKILNEEFPIRCIVDPGTTSGSVDGQENRDYMALKRALKDKYGAKADFVPTPSTSPILTVDDVRFYCLCSGKDDSHSEDGHYGNNVIQVEYAGNRILLTGDSDWRAWKERIIPQFRRSGLLKSTVLVTSHHGSRSFFVPTDDGIDEEEAWEDAYEDHLSLISPDLSIVSCGKQDIHNHPNKTALRKYKHETSHKQVYLTRDTGHFIGRFYRDGRWTVTPGSFLDGWAYNNYVPRQESLNLHCTAYNGNTAIKNLNSGDAMPIGCTLRFRLDASPGLVSNKREATYIYEVSNGGLGKDLKHDEIYDGESASTQEPNTFRRDLSYVGTHLLRCFVQHKGRKAQVIFEITGTAS